MAKSTTPSTRTRRRKTKTEDAEPAKDSAAAEASEAAEVVEKPAKPARSSKSKAKAEQPKNEDFGEGLSDAPEAASDSEKPKEAASGEGSSSENNNEPGTGRRRRRRRRRGGSNSGGRRSDNGSDHSGGGSRHQRGRRGGQQRSRSHSNRSHSTPQNIEDITGILEGVLELHPKGYGFLRDPKKNYMSQDSDAFVSSSFIEKHRLREGILIKGDVGAGTRGQGPRLKSIEEIDGRSVEDYEKIKNFDELTPINPFEQIRLERGARPVTMRVMDLLTPIGKGQRALLVAPPRSGKTMLLQDIAESISENHPEVHLIVLLIDERPEEVTEMQRMVKGEVIASSMDREVESHVRTSQLIMERAKRISEAGGDVVVLLDSITRTGRAFNKWINSGRTGSGGLDVRALDIPRKMFGTARRFDEGGSLTVIATALIQTGSRMDEAIFQEFKGTGNMELVLSRDLADRRIWPAIDIAQSGTRREEKILDPEVLDGVIMLRRSLVSLSSVEAMEQLTQTLGRFPTNAEFLERIREIL